MKEGKSCIQWEEIVNRVIYAGSVGTLGKKASVNGCGEGVYTIYLDDLSFVKYDVAPSENAGIICMSNDRKYVYAANETRDFGGLNGDGGGISAYRIDEKGNWSLSISLFPTDQDHPMFRLRKITAISWYPTMVPIHRSYVIMYLTDKADLS